MQTAIYNQLILDFDCVSFEKYFSVPHNKTPREQYGTALKSTFTAVPFYYLKYLTDKNPSTMYDLGCGWNIFKKYIPNIIGIGAENPLSKNYYADQHDYVDDDYIKGHQNFFDSVFSINALHFIPLDMLKQRVIDFHSMIKPHGSGFLALNIARMLEEAAGKFDKFNLKDLDLYVRNQLYDLDINYKVFDVEFLHDNIDEYMDGNIRLVMEK